MIDINKKEEEKLKKFEEILGISFKNKTILFEALTHSSYTKVRQIKRNNERLEFFGDAVLKLVISEYLYKKYPDYKEGKLTSARNILI